MRKPIVAVVGRPNVGKSTFVNRLIGSRNSIVDDLPGVTRDRIYFDVEWQNKIFTVIDTGGIIPDDEDEILLSIFDQAKIACEEADKIIFIVDGKEGVNPVDYDIANILRQSGKPVFLAVNKSDNPESLLMVNDFYSLAIGEPVGISALHGSGGVGDLLDLVTEDFSREVEQEEDNTIKIAIVGRPNAGKSSIVNALLNENRVIVSDVSGTTRDSIDSYITYKDREFVIVDTAGIRKKSKVDWGVEKFAVDRAIRSIRDCDVALLVIDATEGISDQDKKIASIIMEAGKGLIIAINKWDLVEDKGQKVIDSYTNAIRERLAPFTDFPILFIFALTKQRILKVLETAKEVYNNRKKRIPTAKLNEIMLPIIENYPPPAWKGKYIKIKYITQLPAGSVPSFVFFANLPQWIKDPYKRFLENKIRENWDFTGTPINVFIREK